jgi:hypothetical protein
MGFTNHQLILLLLSLSEYYVILEKKNQFGSFIPDGGV